MSDKAKRERGQVLVIFAGGLFGLIALMALAIDISMVYSTQQTERSLADAAALAGAQDLQSTTGRAVPLGNYTKAKQHALASVAGALGVDVPPTCAPDTLADPTPVIDCSIPPYLVSVKTNPSPSYVNVDPYHAVQVTVRNRSVPLTFARLFGQGDWNVGITSVAGLSFQAKYAIITLRPPEPLPNGLDQNRQNINMNGTNVRIEVRGGDVGSNTSVFTNSGNYLTLDSDYLIYHKDDINPDPWNKVNGEPRGSLMNKLIDDPNYLPGRPTETGLPTFATMAAGRDPGCSLAPAGAAPAGAVCYKPGIYTDNQPFKDNQNTDISYLESGRYFFRSGLDISGTLIGGNVSDGQGVIIVVPNTKSIALNNAAKVSLNFGPDSCNDDGCRSGPALDYELPTSTSATFPLKTPQGMVVTIVVPRLSPGCFDGVTPITPDPCTGSSVINMPGNGQLRMGGVVYAPSDRVAVTGNNSLSVGAIGQIVAWTVTYSGGAKLNQNYPGGESAGVLHLDAACSGGGNLCSP